MQKIIKALNVLRCRHHDGSKHEYALMPSGIGTCACGEAIAVSVTRLT